MAWRNFQTEVSKLTYLTVIVAGVFGFDVKCPEPSQWKFRKQTCFQTEMYSCLYDIDRNIYVESCSKQPDFVKVGKRYILRGGRDSADCTNSRYQSRKFWSNVTSDCEMLKTVCGEEGQIAVSEGSTTEDRACQCDSLNGFGSITTLKDKFACIPSQEDCNCYRKKCTEGELLTKDYGCVNITKDRKDSPVKESEIRLPDSTSSTGKSKTVNTLDNNESFGDKLNRHGSLFTRYPAYCNVLTALLLTSSLITLIAFATLLCALDELCDFRLTFFCKSDVRRALGDKDIYAKKLISNWKVLKSQMNCTEVINELSKYRFMDTSNLQKKELYSRYKEDCILRFIADYSSEIVRHIGWIKARDDTLYHITKLPLNVSKYEQVHTTDINNQKEHLYRHQERLEKYIDLKSDDILVEFIEKFTFELKDMEKIQDTETKSKMNKHFFKIINNTLDKGSYRLWKDIENKRVNVCTVVRDILNDLGNDQEKIPTIDVKLVDHILNNINADEVYDVLFDIKPTSSDTKAINLSEQGICLCASSFMEVFGMLPKKEKTVTKRDVHLNVICINVLKRIETVNVKDLIKQLCIKNAIGTGIYGFDITLSIGEENKKAPSIVSHEQPLNIILANRKFLVGEIDTDIIVPNLRDEIGEKYKDKIKEQQTRPEKAEIICDFLETASQDILKRLFEILKNNEMKKMLERLENCQKIFSYSKGPNHLRYAMAIHFSRIVSCIYDKNLLVYVIKLLDERGVVNVSAETRRCFFENESKVIMVIVEFIVNLMKQGQNAMLHFVDALDELDEHDLSNTLWSYDMCAKGDVCKEQSLTNSLYWARFEVTVT